MMKSLMNKSMTRFTICTVVILVLLAPAFFYLTRNYYAEDLISAVTSLGKMKIRNGIDLENDIVTGVVIQYLMTAIVFIISITVTIRIVTRKLWKPFHDTLRKIESYHLGNDQLPVFVNTDVKEFDQLNKALENLLSRDLQSYKIQKEFTENASHELQTPIAVIRSNLDMLLQEDLNEKAYQIIQNMYDLINRFGRINSNLLLLARIENHQYGDIEEIDLYDLVEKYIRQYANLYSGTIDFHATEGCNTKISANKTLFVVLLNNLVVNALRYIRPGHHVHIIWDGHSLVIRNKALDSSLNTDNMFTRFDNPQRHAKGNGLGLAIARQICDFHHWDIHYSFDQEKEEHCFSVSFLIQ